MRLGLKVELELEARLGRVAGLALEVWVVLQLELCWGLAIDEDGALLLLNGGVGVGAWVGCGAGRVGGVCGVRVGV